ncbi:Trimethylamine-N-oxide reductase [Rhizoctonia solani]|uniref:Trimethylamine-N-oxide reductase n=1 Tax=Rhizoctonia solani TaxID=456999 RepID=A0A0K6FMV7_9AGAM|nr:Trimethylamine-N-oxide reductase [Rhizoctonia solani]
MAAVQHHPWAGRDGWPVRPTLLRVSHDVLLEIMCLLDIYSILSLRRACRVLSAISRDNIIFVRLLKRPFPPPVPGSCPEERVIRTHRLHKNWDLAALPVTARTHRGDTVTRVTRRPIEPPEPPEAPVPVAAPPPLAYHLPPGADAYPFLKLETFAPFRDPTTKQALDRPAPIPISLPVKLDLTEATRSLVQAQVHHITQHQAESSRPPLASNFAAAVVRAWGTTQPPNVSSPPMTCAPHTHTHAPAPRPTRVSSLPLRAIFAKIVGGGRWGVFVIKRDPNFKGKQRADDGPSQPLTTEALASLGREKGKGKEREPAEMQTQLPVDEEAFLVIYDLDEVFRGSGGDPERGQVAEHTLKMTPSTMTCRATENGLVVVLVKSAATGAGAGTSWTTILRWDYNSPELKGLSMHKSSCMLGATSIAELEVEKDQSPRTLVAIVHRPRTVMIQDVDSGQRCFLKLGKVPPIGPRNAVQTVHLIPGPRLLVLRTVQAEQAMYALEEYELPPMGETSQPTIPLQRQWIRSPDLQNCTIVEGPTYADGSLPDLALWTFETAPHRAVTHWLLRPACTADDSSVGADLGHDPPVSFGVDSDVYTPGTAPYVFPAQKIGTSKLSFPHHKITLAPGARRGMWFERPERSRSGQARGMRGLWGYTAIDADRPVVRSCTSELPEDVLGAMENNTLGVAFDELSGRMVAITCGDGYSALTGSQVWVLDYA